MAERSETGTQQATAQLRERLEWVEQAIFGLLGGGAVLGFVGGFILPFWSVQTYGGNTRRAPDLVDEESTHLLGLPSAIEAITRNVHELEEHEPTPAISTMTTVVVIAAAVLAVATVIAILSCELGGERRLRGWHSALVWLSAVATLALWPLTWIFGARPDHDDSVSLASIGIYALTLGAIMACAWEALSRSHRQHGFADRPIVG